MLQHWKRRDNEERHNWLCQCGNGRLAVLESDIPDYCPLCGYPIAAQPEEED